MEFYEDEEDDPTRTTISTPLWQSSDNETYLVGFVIANIVGLQYYTGTISGRELVGLVREPLNVHDCNAIKVLNTRSLQVGHIERSVAAVLAPLIDSGDIHVEGIVPNSGFNNFKIPCQVHVFARFEAFGSVRRAISAGRLSLISNNDAGFGLSEAMVVKEKGEDRNNKNLDKIFKLMDESLNKKGKLGSLDPPKEVIKSELLPHQKEGLWWLVNRESSGELPPFWEEKGGEYVNVLTNYHADIRPNPLRGGILADDMGLGKTLTLLSLIALDNVGCGSSAGNENDDEQFDGEDEGGSVSGGKRANRTGVGKKGAGRCKRRKTGDGFSGGSMEGKRVGASDKSSRNLGRKPTLIVCPPAVFSTWIAHLEEHTVRGSFKVYMYYRQRTQEVKELKKHDIVLTTYSTLAAEESCEDSPMKKMDWWRIILDEAHVIKNANAQQSQAVTNLKATRRWVVTGTPIQNGLFDLFSLMAFLHFEPFSIKGYWQSLVQRPLDQGNKKGLSRLQVIMATISLRRTKKNSLAGLPSKTVETHYIELSEEERGLYERMEVETKGIFQEFINAGSLTCNYSRVLCLILRLRQICDHTALCPSDLRSLLPSNSIEDVSNNPELLKKMISILQSGEDFDCPICISPPNDAIITCCAHIFCRTCILKTIQRAETSCPLCRHPLSISDLFSAPPESSETADGEASCLSKSTSAKVFALLSHLVASRTKNPNTKSVVFSQFQKMLVFLEEPLKAAGFKFLRLDGSMHAKKRAQVIREFGILGPDVPTVLLASLKASGVGINLTAASTVYLLEPWWNPAIEEQAMDRVHRIGQKEEVTVVRFIARNSIEERVLELQDRKKKLASEAFGRLGKRVRSEVGVDDLRALMSI